MSKEREVYQCPIHGLIESPAWHELLYAAADRRSHIPTCPVIEGEGTACGFDLSGPYIISFPYPPSED